MRKTKKRTKITSFREIITFALLAALLTLSGCGEKTVVNPDGTETTQTEKGIKVTETAAKAAQTEAYSCADFDITIPKGWRGLRAVARTCCTAFGCMTRENH